jgi:hypothetical protein
MLAIHLLSAEDNAMLVRSGDEELNASRTRINRIAPKDIEPPRAAAARRK